MLIWCGNDTVLIVKGHNLPQEGGNRTIGKLSIGILSTIFLLVTLFAVIKAHMFVTQNIPFEVHEHAIPKCQLLSWLKIDFYTQS